MRCNLEYYIHPGNSSLHFDIRKSKIRQDGYLIKLRSFRPRLSCPSLTALKLDRPNLITISGDFHRGCLLTIESVSSSKTELSARLKADWLRPNLMKEEPIVLRLSLVSVFSLRSLMPCLFITYSNSFGDSLKILKLLSSWSGVNIEEDTNIQL